MNTLWLKANRPIIVGLSVIAALIVLAIPLWLHQKEKRVVQTSEAYAEALKGLKTDDPKSERETRDKLEKIDLGMAQLYAAHLSFKLGEVERASQAYESFLAKTPPTDPLRPLALTALKTCYESLNQPEKVKTVSAELEKLGFSEK